MEKEELSNNDKLLACIRHMKTLYNLSKSVQKVKSEIIHDEENLCEIFGKDLAESIVENIDQYSESLTEIMKKLAERQDELAKDIPVMIKTDDTDTIKNKSNLVNRINKLNNELNSILEELKKL